MAELLGFFRNSLSREPLVKKTWLIAHSNRNSHFPISVSYNIYA